MSLFGKLAAVAVVLTISIYGYQSLSAKTAVNETVTPVACCCGDCTCEVCECDGESCGDCPCDGCDCDDCTCDCGKDCDCCSDDAECSKASCKSCPASVS